MKANYKRKSLFILLNLKMIHLKRGDKSQWEQNSSAFSDNLLIQHLSSKQQDYPFFVVTATKTILKAFYGLKHLSQLHHKLWPSPHYLYTLVSFIFIFAYICLCPFFYILSITAFISTPILFYLLFFSKLTFQDFYRMSCLQRAKHWKVKISPTPHNSNMC